MATQVLYSLHVPHFKVVAITKSVSAFLMTGKELLSQLVLLSFQRSN